MATHAEPVRQPARQAPEPAAAAAGHGAQPGAAALRETGATLNAGPAVAAQRAMAARLSGAAVVQAKLYKGRTELTRPLLGIGTSKVVSTLMLSPHSFVLRNDCKIADPVVHVLSCDHKYLLGETHGSGQWEARTHDWDVDTMREGVKAFPEEARAGGAAGGTAHDQPLESIHAYALAPALHLRTGVTGLRDGWEDIKKTVFPGWIEEGIRDLKALARSLRLPQWCAELEAVFAEYEAFAGRHAEARDAETAFVVGFAEDARATFVPALHQIVAENAALLALPDRGDDDAIAADADRIFAALENAAKVIGPMVAALLAIIRTHPPGSDPGRIADLASGAESAGAESLRITDPHREAAMIANINAARAPLLVQIGENHLARVRAGVANGVAVSKDEDFNALTRRP